MFHIVSLGENRRIVVLATALAVLLAVPAAALETDQYSAWGQSLDDAGAPISAKFNLEIETVLGEVNSSGGSQLQCGQVAARIRGRLHFLIFQPIEMWALTSALVPRLPQDPDEVLAWRRSNLYSRHGPLDIGTWVPNSPTVEVNGVRFGTDKLAHFVSSGWRYHRRKQRSLARGMSVDAAEKEAIRMGIFLERTILGGMDSGVFSPADLEANYQGMHFYDEMCGGEDPMLGLVEGRWQLLRRFDISLYVTPEWDESYNPPIYTKSRWRKVRPVLEGYCERLHDPWVKAQRAAYLARDSVSITERQLAQKVAAGKLAAPRTFSIDEVCAHLPPPDNPPAAPNPPTPAMAGPQLSEEELAAAILAEQHGSTTRRFSTLGVRVSTPERAVVTYGMLFAAPPGATECRTVCDLHGPLLRAGAGVGGGSLSFGWARLHGETGHNRRLLSNAYLGYAFVASLLHTWGDPLDEAVGRSFAGAEAQFTIVNVTIRTGVFHRIGGPTRRNPWMVTGGIGWGF